MSASCACTDAHLSIKGLLEKLVRIVKFLLTRREAFNLIAYENLRSEGEPLLNFMQEHAYARAH